MFTSIELCVINGAQGGTLKSWPEFVEGLFGGVISSKIYVSCEFISFICFTKINNKLFGGGTPNGVQLGEFSQNKRRVAASSAACGWLVAGKAAPALVFACCLVLRRESQRQDKKTRGRPENTNNF